MEDLATPIRKTGKKTKAKKDSKSKAAVAATATKAKATPKLNVASVVTSVTTEGKVDASSKLPASPNPPASSKPSASVSFDHPSARFDEYIAACTRFNLHPKMFARTHFPPALADLRSVLFYGPPGVGKYTQALMAIRGYSPSELRYQRKLTVVSGKTTVQLKISDVHFEIDLGLLGVAAKTLFHDILAHIAEAVAASPERQGIVLCRSFHHIPGDLLDVFYSYMQQYRDPHQHLACGPPVRLVFLLLTEQLSFVPAKIRDACVFVPVPRPTRQAYEAAIRRPLSGLVTHDVTNIGLLASGGGGGDEGTDEIMNPHRILCNKILAEMLGATDSSPFSFLGFRDKLYDLFICNTELAQCVEYILRALFVQRHLGAERMRRVVELTAVFFQYHARHHRPISHAEKYFLELVALLRLSP